jgi:hypothetical protein
LNNPTLVGVAAVSSGDVWAVGYVLTGTPSDPGVATLIQHWDGTNWAVVPSPSPGAQSSLSAVAVVSADDVWAVGKSDGGTLAEHWDGTAWNVVPTGSAGSQSGPGYFDGVAAVSSHDVWAVGSSAPNGGNSLIEHWDGAFWTAVETPGFTASPVLTDVASFAANDVWAVGTIVSHWDGTRWGVVPGIAENAGFSAVSIVADGSSRDVWAVGLLKGSAGNLDRDTHIERFCGPAVTAPATATRTVSPVVPVLPRTGGSPDSTNGKWLLVAGVILSLLGVACILAGWVRPKYGDRP